MMDVRGPGKQRLRDRGQRAKTQAAELRPAQPAVFKPPVVMVANQPDAPGGAGTHELPREQQIASDAQVVRPNQRVVRARALQQPFDTRPNFGREARRRPRLFRTVPEARLDNKAHRWAAEQRLKALAPIAIGGFATGQHHHVNGQARRMREVRGGQLNDAPDATGTKVTMDDDELHAQILAGANWLSDLFSIHKYDVRARRGECS